jgi:hypothetical protein
VPGVSACGAARRERVAALRLGKKSKTGTAGLVATGSRTPDDVTALVSDGADPETLANDGKVIEAVRRAVE